MKPARQSTPPASRAPSALYVRVRAAFVARGSSLAAWCRANDVHRQYARAVLLHERDGPAARDLRWLLLQAAGVDEQAHEEALRADSGGSGANRSRLNRTTRITDGGTPSEQRTTTDPEQDR